MKGALIHHCVMCAATRRGLPAAFPTALYLFKGFLVLSIYHLHVQVISRASGRSTPGAAAYRAGEVIVEERTGEIHDYTRKRGVLHSEILAPAGAPEWVFNRAELWNKVELIEKRKDAQLCRELDIALPHELTSSERRELIRSYVKKNFVKHGMVADLNLHAPGRGEDNQNFHAHIMLTLRRIEGDGFGKKAREWNSVGMLESWRASWSKMANEALAKAGHEARIDHRSNEARGLDEVPGQHHGPSVAGILLRGEHSDVAQRQEAERAARQAAQLEAQLVIARAQAAAADAELQELEAQEATQAARAAQECELLAQAERQRQAQQAVEDVERRRLEALALARQAHKKAEQQLAQAVQAEGRAGVAVEQLKNARDWAILGQQEADKSLLKTAQALIKAPGWARDINFYDAAVAALKIASRAVQAARQAVTQAWGKVLALDPAQRAAIEARIAAHAAKQAPPPARQQAPQAAPAAHQVQSDDQKQQGPAGPA
ncbi:MAG: MobA/MobL family protein [Polaromonas sp.]|nr:MobA/MobL family protein [Polaromonas sp.]